VPKDGPGGFGRTWLGLIFGIIILAFGGAPPRSHILRRSRLLDQAEEDLHRALIVNVLGQEGSDCAIVILDALASKYGFEADALQIQRARPTRTWLSFPLWNTLFVPWLVDIPFPYPPSGCILGGGHVRRRPLVEVRCLC
jgi:hypothetical protein